MKKPPITAALNDSTSHPASANADRVELLCIVVAAIAGMARHSIAAILGCQAIHAVPSGQGDAAPVVLATQEGIILERRQRLVNAPATSANCAFARLGGATGWLCMNWAWQIPGAIDRLLGGVGLRRGRRNPQEVRVGDAVDFWRVEVFEPDRLLRLRAEMKVPGRAWLEF
jgi:hypothetical protein